jgi:hypothetical protein
VKRRLVNLVSAVSLPLLLCAAAALYVESLLAVDQFVSGSGTRRALVKIGRGTFQFGQSVAAPGAPPRRWTWDRFNYSGDEISPHPWFFSYARNASGWAVSVPLWLFILVPLLVVFAARRRGKKSLRDVCAACGYDLRATPERCPECGNVSANRAVQSTA